MADPKDGGNAAHCLYQASYSGDNESGEGDVGIPPVAAQALFLLRPRFSGVRHDLTDGSCSSMMKSTEVMRSSRPWAPRYLLRHNEVCPLTLTGSDVSDRVRITGVPVGLAGWRTRRERFLS